MKTRFFTRKNILRFVGLLALVFLSIKIFAFVKEKIRIANLKDTASPNVQVLEDFAYIKSLDRKRSIRVYLPPNHDQDTTRYPVFYMLDGENMFSEVVSGGVEWQVDEVIDKTIAEGGPAAIIIGVDSPKKGRLLEYKPFDPETNEDGEGKLLLDYIAYELKPIIDRKYKTLPEKENTGIAGCSLGGIMALYGFTQYPEVFGRAGLFSPSLWVSERFYGMPADIVEWGQRKVYISVGDQEGFMDDDSKKLYQAFLDAGLSQERLKISIEEGLGHYHLTWQQGFRKGFPWMIN